MIDDNTIITYDMAALLSKETMYDLLEIAEPEERERLAALLEMKAKELGCEAQFKRVLKAYYKANEDNTKDYLKAVRAAKEEPFELEKDPNSGKVLNTIENFVRILNNDPKFAGLKFNILRQSPETVENGLTRDWTNADDAEYRRYVEERYKLHSEKKSDDALRIVFASRQYHPIRDLIDQLQNDWDGQIRLETFLCKWMKCEDTPYTREVSRLIFAGGINRLYDSGCKFDDMPVLIGTKQGEGKSTIIQALAMREEWFTEVNEFEGDRAVEVLNGAWICEVSELLALTKAKEENAVKAFLSRQKDRYRVPYDKRPEDRPRQCIMIGSTNVEAFLRDKTGNRRFFPVKVYQNGYYLYDHLEELKADIRQCWAEAKIRFDIGHLPSCFDRKLADVARQEQEKATESDWRVGTIQQYLMDKNKTCVIDLWIRALDNTYSKPTKKDSNEIALILQGLEGWERDKTKSRFGSYGVQQCWTKVSNSEG